MLKKIFYLIKEVESNLNSFFKVQLLVLISSIAELSMVAIIPFWISSFLIEDSDNFILRTIDKLFHPYTSTILIIIVLISSLLSLATLYFTQRYAFTTGQKLSAKLFKQYLKSQYLFKSQENNSILISSLNTESTRISNFFLYPFFLLNSKILVVILVLGFLLYYDLKTTLLSILFFAIFYSILLKTLKSKLNANSKEITDLNAKKFKYAEESIKAAIEINLYNLIGYQSTQFVNAGKILANKMANNNFLAKFPKFVIEFLLFAGVILILNLNNENEALLEKISVFGFASFKILPYIQQIFSSYAVIKGNQDSYEIVKNELQKSRIKKERYRVESVADIELSNVTFKYEEHSTPILSNFSLKLEKDNIYGIVGESGSGKSTIIKLIIGTLVPSSGELTINGSVIQNQLLVPISYVSQKNTVLNSTVCMNITGEEKVGEKEKEKIYSLLKDLKLFEILNKERDPLNFMIHQNGENLSGGQLQRLAIVRALYNESNIIIFDEGTSALDNENQKCVLEILKKRKKNRIIIFSTHDKSILSYCDKVLNVS